MIHLDIMQELKYSVAVYGVTLLWLALVKNTVRRHFMVQFPQANKIIGANEATQPVGLIIGEDSHPAERVFLR